MKYEREIYVNGLKFRVHSVYDQYAASKCGKIVNIDREAILLGSPLNSNYLVCWVRAKNTRKGKTVLLHRFVWECYNGIIPDCLVIDHINDDKIDNRLSNLQLLTTKENNIKAGKNRFARSQPRPVVAINLTTSERHYFPSMNSAGRELGFVPKLVQLVREGLRKTTRSKFDDYRYRFEYLD